MLDPPVPSAVLPPPLARRFKPRPLGLPTFFKILSTSVTTTHFHGRQINMTRIHALHYPPRGNQIILNFGGALYTPPPGANLPTAYPSGEWAPATRQLQAQPIKNFTQAQSMPTPKRAMSIAQAFMETIALVMTKIGFATHFVMTQANPTALLRQARHLFTTIAQSSTATRVLQAGKLAALLQASVAIVSRTFSITKIFGQGTSLVLTNLVSWVRSAAQVTGVTLSDHVQRVTTFIFTQATSAGYQLQARVIQLFAGATSLLMNFRLPRTIAFGQATASALGRAVSTTYAAMQAMSGALPRAVATALSAGQAALVTLTKLRIVNVFISAIQATAGVAQRAASVTYAAGQATVGRVNLRLPLTLLFMQPTVGAMTRLIGWTRRATQALALKLGFFDKYSIDPRQVYALPADARAWPLPAASTLFVMPADNHAWPVPQATQSYLVPSASGNVWLVID